MLRPDERNEGDAEAHPHEVHESPVSSEHPDTDHLIKEIVKNKQKQNTTVSSEHQDTDHLIKTYDQYHPTESYHYHRHRHHHHHHHHHVIFSPQLKR